MGMVGQLRGQTQPEGMGPCLELGMVHVLMWTRHVGIDLW